MFEKQLDSCSERLESHELQVQLHYHRLKAEMNQEMGRLTRKSRLRLDLIVQSNPKHANEVEILDVQGKFNDGGIEHNKSITTYNDYQDFGVNDDIYNTSDVFVDKLARSSVFIYATKT